MQDQAAYCRERERERERGETVVGAGRRIKVVGGVGFYCKQMMDPSAMIS